MIMSIVHVGAEICCSDSKARKTGVQCGMSSVKKSDLCVWFSHCLAAYFPIIVGLILRSTVSDVAYFTLMCAGVR